MANIEYQTNMTALVEKIKTAVRCSRLWVLLPGPPGALGAGRVPPPHPRPNRTRLCRHLLKE